MVKRFARFLICLILSVLLLTGLVLLWFKMSVRDVSWVKPRLIEALNPPDSPIRISFDTVTLEWRRFSEFGRLTLGHIAIARPDGSVFVSMPSAAVTIDPLGFMPHRHEIYSIILDSPKLDLARGIDGTIRVGWDGSNEAMPLNDLLGGLGGSGGEGNPDLPFRVLTIQNATLTMQDVDGSTLLSSTPFAFRLARFHGLNGMLFMPFTYGGKPGRLIATLSPKLTTHERELSLVLNEFPVELLCTFNLCTDDMSGSGRVTGKAVATFTRKTNQLTGASVTLTAHDAVAKLPKLFPEPLTVKSAQVSGLVDQGGQHFTVTNAKLVTPDVPLTVQGQFWRLPQDDWRLQLHGIAGKLQVNKLANYWPIVLAGDSRAWVTGKLKAGYANSGEVTLDITKAMYETNAFTPASVNAVVDARDITAEYLEGFPELKHSNGIAHFIGNTMQIDSTSGNVLGATVTSGSLHCENLHDPHAPMTAVVSLNAPAPDAVNFLSLKQFTFDDGWNLDPKKITGTVDTTLKLGFDAFSNDPAAAGIHFEKVKYDLTADLKQIAQPGLLGMNITGLSGTVAANNATMKFDGKLALGTGAGLDIHVADDAKGATTAELSGSIPRAQFAALGLPDRTELGEGTMGLDAHLALNKGSAKLQRATLDFTDMALDLVQLSWSKKRGEKATASLTAQGTNEYALGLHAPGLTAENATLALAADNNLQSLNLPHVTAGENDFALNYRTTANGFAVKLTGQKLDARAAYAQSDNGLLSDFPPVTLDVDLAELELTDQAPLKQVKGNLTCNTARCESANLSAKVGRGTLRAIISKPKGARQFSLTTGNAGDFLKALDITDRVYGGTLDLTGGYDEKQQPATFHGRLLIQNYTLKNSQILGRILSIASITGLANALTGSGISFEKLGADIYEGKGLVTVKNGRSSGASIGITVEGTVDTNTTKLDLKGVLVPAYFFNSIVTKIPLIGKLAGKEGEGLFAFNYSIKGTYENPDVSVNPLSGLTPGFLRNIFGAGGGDSSSKTAKPSPAYPGDDKPAAAVTKPAEEKPAETPVPAEAPAAPAEDSKE